MKAKIFLGVLFLLITFLELFVFATAQSSVGGGGGRGGCADSDGGRDFYVKGKVTYSSGDVLTDYCIDKEILKEYFCGERECEHVKECPEPSEPSIPNPRIIVNGNIYINSNGQNLLQPIAMEIYANGELLGTWGFNKPINEGAYDFLFKYDGYKDCEKEIQLNKGEQTSVKVILRPVNSNEECDVNIGVSEYSGSGSSSGSGGCTTKIECKEIDKEEKYSCKNGCSNGACIESGEEDRDDETTSTTTTYFKNCNYVWDSSHYVGQTIKITASIKDSSGSTDSDFVNVNVLESVLGGTEGAYSMDGKTLDIQIIEPGAEDVARAVQIKINSRGPNELGEMSLGFSGENWGAGFPISNRNCVAGGSGGGGSGGGNTCEKYHICEDGTEVQYCEIVKQYDENGNVIGAGCGCKSNPEELCTSSSFGGGGGSEELTEIPSFGGGGGSGGNDETPIICNGCILGDKCVPVGYRTDDEYCNIESELVSQLNAEKSCNNNFECSTNLCIDNQCLSSGIWQKFIRWLSRLFG